MQAGLSVCQRPSMASGPFSCNANHLWRKWTNMLSHPEDTAWNFVFSKSLFWKTDLSKFKISLCMHTPLRRCIISRQLARLYMYEAMHYLLKLQVVRLGEMILSKRSLSLGKTFYSVHGFVGIFRTSTKFTWQGMPWNRSPKLPVMPILVIQYI